MVFSKGQVPEVVGGGSWRLGDFRKMLLHRCLLVYNLHAGGK
jgi:hypothetical protein